MAQDVEIIIKSYPAGTLNKYLNKGAAGAGEVQPLVRDPGVVAIYAGRMTNDALMANLKSDTYTTFTSYTAACVS